jgi:hypothetical protein
MTQSTMTPLESNVQHHENDSLADKLRGLAVALQAREESLQERENAMQAKEQEISELAIYKKVAYALICEKSLREVPPLPERIDLKAWIEEQAGVPLDDFLNELGK